MNGRRYRGFDRIDAAALILAAMAGLGMMAVESAKIWGEVLRRPEDGRWDGVILARRFRTGVLTFLPLGWALTAAVLLLGLRPPRAERRRLLRRPGLAACLVVTVVAAIDLPATRAVMVWNRWEMLGFRWVRTHLHRFVEMYSSHFLDIQLPGFAVLAAWLTLGLAGRWRGEPSWVDRAGRRLGLVWVAIIGCYWVEMAF